MRSMTRTSTNAFVGESFRPNCSWIAVNRPGGALDGSDGGGTLALISVFWFGPASEVNFGPPGSS